MNYKAKIVVDGDPIKLYKLFHTELLGSKRSSCSIQKQKKGVVFEITSKDSVALRATLNSITKLLTVYEKIEKL